MLKISNAFGHYVIGYNNSFKKMKACFETKPPTCPKRWVILFWSVFLKKILYFSFEGKEFYLSNLLNTMLHFTNKLNSQNSKYQQKYANWKTIYCHIPYETFYYQELQVNRKKCLTIRWGNWCVIIEEYIAMIGPITLVSYINTNKLWWNDIFYGKYDVSF